jgi:hypothetical protein
MKDCAMKPLLLLLTFTTAAIAAQAQEFEPDMQKLLKSYIAKQKGKETFSAPNEKGFPAYKQGETHKPGVYALPQDGMPCIVPSTAGIVAIPNAFSKKEAPKLGQIPNAAPRTGDAFRKNQQRSFVPPAR